jgi:hypothetical protein
MARRTIRVTVSAEGRDLGRVYLLTELPASQAEEWADQVFLGLMRNGAQIPDEVASAGLAGVASMGVDALKGLDWYTVKPLLDTMMSCVQAVPTPSSPNAVRPLVESDIEEVATRLMLRGEVISLHLGFSLADALSKLRASRLMGAASPDTPTSPASSEPSSLPV